MGVPKFYRWISERYPNMSRVINDNQLPDFDNFYLDMNGIIHSCSHINEDNCEINVTEEEIYRNIFDYLDFLFRMIKPKKVFFMAIDGVAPRAKMNQQRARRFRAGKERMKKLKAIAERTGRTLQETAANHFDTNAITPGTQFMANLNEQLKYFIHVKLTSDPLWENVDVHLSGHLTPGEGEHKIMEYIRYIRSQPGYNVNTRHCLYGLDADLIMLGLVTHEIHFALLREDVKFGSKRTSKILAPGEINWHLFHTCLLRDYIDLEFRSIRDKLQFPYNLDRIVDDWILMGYLVGNDFIPHLPHFHINEEALSILWDTYKQVLPTLDGYMNESGELNLPRFEIYLTELAKFDHQRYANENDTFKHLEKLNQRQKNPRKNKSQSEVDGFDLSVLEKLTIPTIDQKQESNTVSLNQAMSSEPKSPDISSLSDDNDLSSDSSTINDESDDDDDDEEKKNSSRTPVAIHEDDIEKMPLIEAEFRQHKNHYYRDKMKINLISSDQLQIYVDQYIEALQWILKYYYQSCPSWSWFYPQHYAPYLSDLKNFKHLNLIFQTGTPFKPFEQLLSVLPPTSRHLLPNALQPLMIDPTSPLLHFYPENFQLDQNEKRQDWEAIVLLPFIDEELLLNSITKFYNQLDPNEQIRNQYLPSLCFTTTSQLQPIGNSLGINPYFLPLKETRAICREFPVDSYRLESVQIKYGRFEERDVVNFPKFPILNVLPYRFAYKNGAVNLFETRSKSPTLVLSLTHRPDADCITYNHQSDPRDGNPVPPVQITNNHLLIERYLGKRVFVNWPHFQYGIVCAISDFRHLYTWSNIPGGSYFYSEPINIEENLDLRYYIQTPIYVSCYPFEVSNDYNKKAIYNTYPFKEMETQIEYTKAMSINRDYESRQGISIGPIPILLYVSPLIGYRTKCVATSDKCRTTMCFSNQAFAYPLQTTLFKLPNYKDDLERIPQTINDYYKINDPIFALQSPYYSSLGYVQQIKKDNHGKYSILCQMDSSDVVNQPDIHHLAPKLSEHQLQYFTAQEIADQLKTAGCVVSKITGKTNVISGNKRRRRANPTNIGLSWKANKPVKQLYGYTKKIDQIWYYSETAVSIISDYMLKFPEIIAELEKKPRDDNYFESNIWPDKNGKHELQQVRIWIKSLPTYSVPLTDAAWELLDAPVIDEIEKNVKSYYTKQAAKNPTKKTKIISLDPSHLFKTTEFLGFCDPDIETRFSLFDRVVNVRLDTGVPIGTRGTITGIMLGRTNLDTSYEILFDNLPSNNLDAILLGKSQQKCRIKVRSYHLLNYTHSLRVRSMNYQQQQFAPAIDVREQTSRFQQQQQQQSKRISKKESKDNNAAREPKSAPPLTAHDRPYFVEDKEQRSNTNNPPIQSFSSVEDPSSPPPLAKNLSSSQIIFTPMDVTMPKEAVLTSFASNSTSNALFFRAIQDSEQTQHPSYQYADPSMFPQQVWDTTSSQHFQNPSMTGNMSQASPYSFEQQSSMYVPSQFQQPSAHFSFQPGMQQSNSMYPMEFEGINGAQPFAPYDLPLPGTFPGYRIGPMGNPTPINYGQQQQQQQLPTQIQDTSVAPRQFIPTSPLSADAQPFQPQQSTSPGSTNRQTLQFIPSQVLRNIPKKS